MLDSIIEYAPQFSKAGLSAEQMFNIMASGYEAGAWNLDKVGDAVKELNIRLVDGSKTTAEGLEMIGMNADEVAKKMSEGGETATETYKQVVKGLAEKMCIRDREISDFGTSVYEDMETLIMQNIIRHIQNYDQPIDSDTWLMQKMAEIGKLNEENIKIIAKAAGLGATTVERMLQEVVDIVMERVEPGPVSYTHLDVYKRQNIYGGYIKC